MTTLRASQTRCTLCSLGCALGFERTPLGNILAGYPGQITELRHGICGRGHLNFELLDHPCRLEHPLVRKGDRLEAVPLDGLAQALTGKLANGPTLVLADGTLFSEDLVAAATFARLLGNEAVFCVYMDPADEGMLAGVAASGALILTPEGLAECDGVLSIGDAFGTHPVISRGVHAITKRNPRRVFAVIDSVPSRTTKLSNAFLQVRPGTTSCVLRFLAGEAVTAAEAAGKAQVAQGELTTLAAKLSGARKLGVLVNCDFGREPDPRAVGLLAGRIAQKGSGGVVPLPILGNAWGALGISRAFGATPTGEALAQLGEGKFKNVILLGIDPSAETPLKGLSEALAKTQTLIVATWLNPAAQTPGTHFLPLAAAVEAAGTVVSGSGEVMELPAVASPAGGAMAARELLSSLGANLGEGGTLSTMVRPEWLKPISASPQECLRDEAVLVEPGRDELVAVSESGCVHVGSGTVSARMSWPKAFEKNPTVRISPADAAQRGFGDSQTVTVSSANSSASMTVKVDMAMRPGRVALMATSPAVRRLFNWGKSGDGRIVSGPVAVRVSAS